MGGARAAVQRAPDRGASHRGIGDLASPVATRMVDDDAPGGYRSSWVQPWEDDG